MRPACQGCFNIVAFPRLCLYHTRCCFIHFRGVAGAPSLGQEIVDTPSSAHLEGIHRGRASTLPRLRAEIQALRSAAAESPAAVAPVADKTMPRDAWER